MKWFFTALIIMLALAPGIAYAQKVGDLTISHAIIREAMQGAKVAGGFFTIKNAGTKDDRLLSIESKSAKAVELHQSTLKDGIARMRPLENGLVIPAGKTASLGDDGTHAMFMEPTSHYKTGEEISAVLVFEKAGKIPVKFKV